MKTLLFIFLSLNLFASDNPFYLSNNDLELCYKNGDDKCGKTLALNYKEIPEQEERAAEIFLDLSLKGDQDSTRELGLLYIYGKTIPRDCQKGVFILLNAADGKQNKKESAIAFKDIALLFKKGICVPEDYSKFEKYNKIYQKKLKEEIQKEETLKREKLK